MWLRIRFLFFRLRWERMTRWGSIAHCGGYSLLVRDRFEDGWAVSIHRSLISRDGPFNLAPRIRFQHREQAQRWAEWIAFKVLAVEGR